MKRESFMGAVVVGTFLIVFAGVSQGSGFGPTHKSGDIAESWGPVKAGAMKSADRSSGSMAYKAASPEFNSTDALESWGPVGTGSVSGADDGNRLLDAGVDPARWEEPNAE